MITRPTFGSGLKVKSVFIVTVHDVQQKLLNQNSWLVQSLPRHLSAMVFCFFLRTTGGEPSKQTPHRKSRAGRGFKPKTFLLWALTTAPQHSQTVQLRELINAFQSDGSQTHPTCWGEVTICWILATVGCCCTICGILAIWWERKEKDFIKEKKIRVRQQAT